MTIMLKESPKSSSNALLIISNAITIDQFEATMNQNFVLAPASEIHNLRMHYVLASRHWNKLVLDIRNNGISFPRKQDIIVISNKCSNIELTIEDSMPCESVQTWLDQVVNSDVLAMLLLKGGLVKDVVL